MRNICTVEGCSEFCVGRGLCRNHWTQYRRSKEFIHLDGSSNVCKIVGCNESTVCKNMCTKHYNRFKRHQDAHKAPIKRQITKEGYIKLNIDGKRLCEHRVVMERIIGRKLRKNEDVHHINGIRDDNRPANLELWNHSHPRGQRVEEKIKWALEFLKQYGAIEFNQTEITSGQPLTLLDVVKELVGSTFVVTQIN